MIDVRALKRVVLSFDALIVSEIAVVFELIALEP